MSSQKVFITGMGAITSLGEGISQTFAKLLENKSGVKHFPDWQKHKGLLSHLGAPVPPYDIMKVPRSVRRTMSPMSEMATLATFEALQMAGLSNDSINTPRTLLGLGSTTGSPENLESYFKKLIERGGPEGQMGTAFFKVMSHSVPANVAAALGFHGAMFSPSSACATSAQAMILGWELIQSGLYDVVIAGGADELHYTSAAVFDTVLAASRAYNDDSQRSPRPFDKNRDGLVVSEGAAVVIMESEANVRRRQKKEGQGKIQAEFLGGAYLCDGSHMSQSSVANMMDVMNLSLERSKITKSQVQYINAHATATIQGDQAEAEAIKNLFGNGVPVSSLKGHFGHSLAACGTLEVINSIQMMQSQTLIGTRNLEEVDPACSGILHIQKNRAAAIKTVMSNNFAFGGMNTSVVVSRE